jgi:hypothetical protein
VPLARQLKAQVRSDAGRFTRRQGDSQGRIRQGQREQQGTEGSGELCASNARYSAFGSSRYST